MAVAADGHHGLIVDAAVIGRCGRREFAAEALKLRHFLLEDVAKKWTKPRHFRVRSNCFFLWEPRSSGATIQIWISQAN